MFGEDAFRSWVHVLTGALAFALLFALLGAMTELVLLGADLRVTSGVFMLGVLAFVGYLGAAVLGRREPPDGRP